MRSSAVPTTQHPLKPAQGNGSTHERVVLLVLALSTLLLYGAACAFEFSSWDDAVNLVQNPWINDGSWGALSHLWSHSYARLYIPLTYTVWWLLAQVGRVSQPDINGSSLNPYVFHAANVAAHLLSVLVTYTILKLLVGHRWPAAAGAALFAAHPLQVETVAWVTGMRDLLGGLLSLLALLQFLRFAKADQCSLSANENARAPTAVSSRRWTRYASATGIFLLALLAKPSAASLPLSVFFLAWLMLGLPAGRVLKWIMPWLALSLACILWTRYAQIVAIVPDGGRWWLRPLIALDALAFYLTKLVFPANLCVIYNRSPAAVIASGAIEFTWLIPALVGAAAFTLRRRAPWLGTGFLLIVAALLPVLGLIPFHFQAVSTVADHYFYQAMLGPALIVAYLVRAAASRRPWLTGIVVLLILTTCATATERQLFVWKDNQTLFLHAAKINPNSFAIWDNLALALQGNDQFIAAMEAYRRAEALSPDDPIVHDGMAGLYGKLGEFDAAEYYFRQALRADPTDTIARDGLEMVREFRQAQKSATRRATSNLPSASTQP